jgi:hypothetical protein
MVTDLMRKKRRDINLHRREMAEQERADATAREKQAEKDRIIYEDRRESFFTPVSSDNLATGSASDKKRRGSVFGNTGETVLGN